MVTATVNYGLIKYGHDYFVVHEGYDFYVVRVKGKTMNVFKWVFDV
jgi:hypothetical protein